MEVVDSDGDHEETEEKKDAQELIKEYDGKTEEDVQRDLLSQVNQMGSKTPRAEVQKAFGEAFALDLSKV